MIQSLETFQYNGTPIQVLGTYSEPLFVAKEVCEALNLADHRSALRKLDNDEKGEQILPTPGGKQSMTVINEPGLYSLVLRSTKPEAKAFKRWITHEVLPAIRKHGHYGSPKAIERKVKIEMAKHRLAEYIHGSNIWHKETVERFTEIEKFLTAKELARIFNCSPSSVTKLKTLMRRASGDFSDHRPEELRPEPTPQLSLLEDLPRLAAPQETKESIWRMRMVEGKTYPQIAEETGYSVSACRQFVHKMNAQKEGSYEVD